jgi:hypothetical protein
MFPSALHLLMNIGLARDTNREAQCAVFSTILPLFFLVDPGILLAPCFETHPVQNATCCIELRACLYVLQICIIKQSAVVSVMLSGAPGKCSGTQEP